jgi:predicted MFS family arabinose efflux permease
MSSQSYKRYVTGLLLAVYILNLMDRAIFGFLMEPIKQEFGLSDSQLAFLLGPALVVCYAILGVPIARWGDRHHRVNMMSFAIALWSGIVMLSAVVGKFWHLVLVRVGVGIGEAGFSAIAQSVIGDYHAETERARAVSTFMLGIPIAGVISSLMSGWINETYGWRAVFIVAGVPGILAALLMRWTVREPPRRVIPAAPGAEDDRPSFRSVFSTLWQTRTLRHLIVAQALANIVSCCMGWSPAFFMRAHEMSSGEFGTWLAVIVGVGGITGIWLSGRCVGLRLTAVATALTTPFVALVLWSPSKHLALLAFIPAQALMLFFLGPTSSVVLSLTAANMRATMASVFILVQLLAGGVIGVQLIGILSDALLPIAGDSAAALRWSMTLASLLGLWAAAHFWLAHQALSEEEAAVTKCSGSNPHL